MNKNISITFTGIPDFRPLPDYGDHMTLEEYRQCGFIDYDGFGELATDNQVAHDMYTRPSELEHTTFPEWCTHIVWYNR